jgi:hypothetical protein
LKLHPGLLFVFAAAPLAFVALTGPLRSRFLCFPKFTSNHSFFLAVLFELLVRTFEKRRGFFSLFL